MTGARPLRTIIDFSLPLIFGVVCAVLWANLDPHGYHEFIEWAPVGDLSFEFLVNDLFMVLFFGIAAKEITEACLPGGALNPPSRAVNPVLATLGGVLGPVGVFFLFLAISGDHAPAHGWGIPTATDIALAWLVARIAFGNRHPAVSFLLLLAVADDGLGLGIIAVFYPDPSHPVQPAMLLLVAAAMAFAYVLRRRKVQNFWPYLLGPGVLSWIGLYTAHLHPALALVAVVPFMPHAKRDEGLFAEFDDQGPARKDALNRFEHAFKTPVELGLFFFGIANAGVGFSSVGTATWAVLLALVVGKTVGIFTLGTVAHFLGFRLAGGMSFRSLFVAAMTASLGLTVALFVAGVAFTDPTMQGSAKMGALLSACITPVVIVAARVLKVRDEIVVSRGQPTGEDDDEEAELATA